MARSMKMTMIRVAVLALSLFSFSETVASQQVLVVGGRLGWTIPPAGPAPYDAWAASHIFIVGDILVFNFTNGDQDVARVTREAFLRCNTTNPIEVKKTNPANFTLNSTGDFYFTSTLDRHCESGQKLAVHVLASGPSPSSQPKPRGPRNFTVGGDLGWIVPPGGEIVYKSWARTKTFRIGDALEFLFINGTQDVAEVRKEDYEKCQTNSSIAVYSSSPVRIVLNTTGEHFYTSTYLDHCALGQKLAINVTSNTSSSSSSSSGSAFSPEGAMPPSTPGSSATRVVSAYMPAFVVIALAFFHF
ncbi:blue copper protein-like [Prosopis cineraria]|uniref:blue copper protein-like n=1 Tax=Prosopis cineraria TaxID=364024 RepID=UPI00240EC0CB|nr:blue copper protein-like [Prosopis cineraria]